MIDNQPVVDLNFLQISKYFFSNRYVILIFVIAFPAIVGLWLFFVKKPVYSSSSKVAIDMNSNAEAMEDRMSFFFLQEQKAMSKMNQIEELLGSNLFYQEALNFFNDPSYILKTYKDARKNYKVVNRYMESFYGVPGEKLSNKVKASILSGNLNQSSDIEKRTMNFSATSKYANLAAAMTNLGVILVLENNHREILKQERSIINFLSGQARKLEASLQSQEVEYTRLQKKYRIYSEDIVASQLTIAHLQRVKAFEKVNRDLVVTRKVHNNLLRDLNSIQKRIGKDNSSSLLYLTQLQKRMELLDYQASVKDARSPSSLSEKNNIKEKIDNIVIKFKAKVADQKPYLTIPPLESIKSIERKINEVEANLFELNAKKRAQKKIVDSSINEIKDLPDATRKLLALKRKIDLTSNLYKELIIKLQEVRVREAGQVNDLKVISTAEPSGRPSGLGVKKSMALSMLLGFFTSLFILILKYVLVPTVRYASDIEKLGVKVVGSLPFCRGSNGAKFFDMKISTRVLIKEGENSYQANLIRNVRYLLERQIVEQTPFTSTDQGKGSILAVCSTNSNEGKTFISSNLAQAFALADKKVLLVDIDFGKPEIRDYFDTSDLEELETYTIGNLDLTRKRVDENLDILDAPVYKGNVSDKIQGSRFRSLLDELTQKYDYIIIDTPAMDGSIEPLIIAGLSDFLLFIVNQRITMVNEVRESISKLSGERTNNVFAIMNYTYEEFKILSNKVDAA